MEEKNDVKPSLIEDLLDEDDFISEEEKDTPEFVDVNSLSESETTKAQPAPSPTKQTFNCDKCSLKYYDLELLAIHSAKHSPDMNCPVCPEVFTSRKTLSLHIDAHIRVKTKDLSVCSYCPKSFSTRKKLVTHIRVHTNERPYKCKICGEGFKQLGSLTSHHVTHTKEKKYVCEICNGAYTTLSSLKRHKKKIHDKQKTLDCKHCSAKFHNRNDLTQHLSEKHVNALFKAACPVCSEVFFSRHLYDQHKQQHGDLFPRKRLLNIYTCKLCGEKLKTSKLFLEHQLTHLSYTESDLEEATKTRSFQCKFCPVVRGHKIALFKHMAVHMEKSHKCDLCKKCFTFYYLTIHKTKIHGVPEDRVRFKAVPKKNK